MSTRCSDARSPTEHSLRQFDRSRARVIVICVAH
jgi:hypothetical protein